MILQILIASLILASSQSPRNLTDSTLIEIAERYAVSSELAVQCLQDEQKEDSATDYSCVDGWVTDVAFGSKEIVCLPSLDSLKIVTVSEALYRLSSGYSRGRVPSATYWVAFDAAGERYRIRGFDSSTTRSERERLVKSIGASGWTDERLLALAELYFTVTRQVGCWGRGEYRIVQSIREAEDFYKELIERWEAEFADEEPDEDGYEWTPPKVPKKFDKLVTAPVTTMEGDTNVVSFFVAEMGARAFLSKITTTVHSVSIVDLQAETLWFEP